VRPAFLMDLEGARSADRTRTLWIDRCASRSWRARPIWRRAKGMLRIATSEVDRFVHPCHLRWAVEAGRVAGGVPISADRSGAMAGYRPHGPDRSRWTPATLVRLLRCIVSFLPEEASGGRGKPRERCQWLAHGIEDGNRCIFS